VRVCNAYLLDDQMRLGQLLVWISVGVALAWFACLVRTLMHSDAAAVLPAPLDEGAVTAKSIAPGSH
ncbi:MAG: hypothetical protein ACREBY_04320, partial [Polaromonas sp.]